MNALSPPPSGSPSDAATPVPVRRAPPRRSLSRADREFLPAALEILEQPPSPIALALLVGICVFALTAVAWAWIGEIDIVAVAHGKLQPAGKVKVVQPLEAGRVKAILVQNGSAVREGDALVEFDPDEALAEVRAAAAAHTAWQAEALRRTDVLAVAATDPVTDRPMTWPESVPGAVRTREEAVREADIRKLAGDLAALDAQAGQKRAERERISRTIVAQEALIAVQQERVDMRSNLLASKAGSRANVIDAVEALNYQSTVLATQRGQIVEADRALDALAAERTKVLDSFIAENAGKRAEAQRQAEEAEQRLARGRVRLERTTLRSPTTGIVQASNVTSLGQVLSAGQEAMRVVPEDAELEVEAYLENKDIGFVTAGQQAELKIEAFPFTRYGVLDAVVTRVARDAIAQPDPRQVEGDPTRPADARGPPSAERVGGLVFPVILTTKARHVLADGRSVPLGPGMTVIAEIKTGKRRILEYLLSPLVETATEALRER